MEVVLVGYDPVIACPVRARLSGEATKPFICLISISTLVLACPPTALEFFHLENWEHWQYWRRKDAQFCWLDSKERNQATYGYCNWCDSHVTTRLTTQHRPPTGRSSPAPPATPPPPPSPEFGTSIRKFDLAKTSNFNSHETATGIAPSFDTIPHACSHGYEFLVSMSGDYGIFPNANAMPFEPQALAWTTLLSSKVVRKELAGLIIDM
ncbi:hypothetical protein SELMODRAFT_413771 [Selaginella moellendorffii]|uniref:Uncharacterized protein n=1 Tax=Selaginella moellendorffii TaxID=88036 RepID=D8RQ63_SELML|nr:hypothetical protein SELMODRAFT_413771 [Selaginella moellendorffii]